MEKKKMIKILHIIGIFFTIIFGTLLHYTYEWSGNNALVGLFSPVNESTVEHLKMILVPFFIFSIIEYFVYGKNIPYYILIKASSVLLGMITILAIFYGYTWILGDNVVWIDIAIFVLSVVVAYCLSWRLINYSDTEMD